MTERRRVLLFDVMVLIAATAVGLWVAQFGWPRQAVTPAGTWIFTWPVLPSRAGYPSTTWMRPFAERAAPALPLLAAWTGAFLVTRCHAPRPRRRRLLLQPGLIAAVAALSVLAVESALLIGSARVDGRFIGSNPARIAEFASNAVVMLAHHAGLAVAASWCTLAFIGRWRSEGSWVDRWGRALGFTWIAIGPMASLLIDHAPWWGKFLGP